MSSAILMPFERMRVGINSDSASQTQTPGPIAKNAMNAKIKIAVIQPLLALGTGVMSAFSILSGAVRAASRSANGFEKNAIVLFAGTQLARLISTGLAVASSERATVVAARKSP